MLNLVIVLVALVLIWGGATQYLRARRPKSDLSDYMAHELTRMPGELRRSQLVASERDMICQIAGNPVSVRPDQVYRTPDGIHVPVDTKTRSAPNAFDYDIIELSIHRLAWAQKVGPARVARHGYVRIRPRDTGAPTTYIKVDLLDESRLAALYHRYQAILDGRIRPSSQPRKSACQRCSHRRVCTTSAA